MYRRNSKKKMAVGVGENEYTMDGTVDLKGNPILRSKRGGWTACSFIVGYEVFERMCYCGISANLVLYLTRNLHQGTVAASNNVTYWTAAVWITPIFGAYVADAHLGRYWTFLLASAFYFLGMCLLTIAVSVPALKPAPCNAINVQDCPKGSTAELAVFFTALYILAIGTGGTKPNISTIGADQFDDFDPREKALKLSFFNWWVFSIFIGFLFGNTFLVYIQDNVGWGLGYGIPTLGLALAITVFLIGTPFYRHKKPQGNCFDTLARVIVAALRKRNVAIPPHFQDLHDSGAFLCTNKGLDQLQSNTTLRFLNKACVPTNSSSPWMLCTVTQVEETKQVLKMLPILISTFIPSVMVAQTNTLFIKQGSTLDQKMGRLNLPPASLGAFVTITMLICIVLHDRVFVKIARKWTKNPRGITLLQRVGAGFVLHIIVMIISSVTERHRLNVAKKHGLVESGDQVPLSIFILLPQFILMGVADACTEVAKLEFFYDQAPETMKSLGTSFYSTSMGIGSLLSSFILSTTARVTREIDSRGGWILNNLNASRLDLYFLFLAALCFLNFIAFIGIVRQYQYKAEISDSMEVLKEELEGVKSRNEVELAAQGN